MVTNVNTAHTYQDVSDVEKIIHSPVVVNPTFYQANALGKGSHPSNYKYGKVYKDY